MDKTEAQRLGAEAHERQEPLQLPNDADDECRVMFVHGWRTGHETCDCRIYTGQGKVLNGFELK